MARRRGPDKVSRLKRVIFVLCLVPLALLLWRAFDGDLGVNPIEKVNRTLGDWAMRFLWLSLAVTPLRYVSGWTEVARLRRMLGLFAFAYACLHVTSYLVLDQFFDWAAIWRDIVKRKYITVGMIAFVLLLPLAATSTNAMIRRLGGRRWRALHRLVYPAGLLVALHYFWMVKRDISQPLLYASILGLLLAMRLIPHLRRNAATAGKQTSRTAQLPSE